MSALQAVPNPPSAKPAQDSIQFNLELPSGRKAVLFVPTNSSDEELLSLAGAIAVGVRQACAANRVETRLRLPHRRRT